MQLSKFPDLDCQSCNVSVILLTYFVLPLQMSAPRLSEADCQIGTVAYTRPGNFDLARRFHAAVLKRCGPGIPHSQPGVIEEFRQDYITPLGITGLQPDFVAKRR